MTNTHTSIEWTDATWNIVTGCTKVSDGCTNCYAERITNRFGGPGAFDTVVLHPERLDAPLRWRKPRRVFVNSMSDLFHDDVPNEYIARVFAVMGLATTHTFQVLTKRPARMRALLASDAFRDEVGSRGWEMDPYGGRIESEPHVWPFANVWLGVSVENQKWADIRIPKLLETPAAVRFLSCEPLLGPIDLAAAIEGGQRGRYDAHRDRAETAEGRPGLHEGARRRAFDGGVGDLHPEASQPRDGSGRHDDGARGGTIHADRSTRSSSDRCDRSARVDWAIIGGESGPGARPMHPEWARSLRDQCIQAGVPFFFKQQGSWGNGEHHTGHRARWVTLDGKVHPWGDVVPGKGAIAMHYCAPSGHAGGRALDGREWNEYPAVGA